MSLHGIRLLVGVAAVCAVTLEVPAAWAAGPGSPLSPQAALETLLSSSAGKGSGSTAPAGKAPSQRPSPGAATPDGRKVVQVAPGQSWDRLIKAHLASSPLKPEVLRELIIELNPGAVGPAPRRHPIAGARLALPSMEDQRIHAFGKGAASAANAHQDLGGDGGASARRNWIRYQ